METIKTYGGRGWAERQHAYDVIARRVPFRSGAAIAGTDNRLFAGTGRLSEPWRTMFYDGQTAGTIDYYVSSYATPIAWHDTEAGWIVPDVQHSVTTSKHQGLVRTALAHAGAEYRS